MKRFITLSILCIVILSSCTSQRNINQFYSKYQGTENSISYKAPLFLASLIVQDPEITKSIRGKVKSIRVLTLDELEKNSNTKVAQELNSALERDGFDSWFNMNKNGRVINVSTQNRGKSLKNLVVAVQGEENFVFINAKTNLTENELMDFINAVTDAKLEDKTDD